MADIFKRAQLRWGGAFAAETGLLTPNKGLNGVLMQQLQAQYTQQVSRIYEIGPAGSPSAVYYVAGRPSGSMSVAHVVGPGIAMTEYYNNFSDVCSAEDNDIQLNLTKTRCDAKPRSPYSSGINTGSGSVSYKCKFCVLTMIGIATQSQDLLINESSQLTFANMEFAAQ